MKKIVPIAILLALAIAVAGWLTYNHRPAQRTPQAQSTSAPAEQKSSTPAQAELGDIEKALNSADGKTQLDALTPETRSAYKASGQDRFVPAGSTVKLDTGTFKSNGNFASVEATFTSPDNVRGDFSLLLTRSSANSAWRVLDLQQK